MTFILLNIFAVIGAFASIIAIIVFFKKPFKYRFLWLFISLAGCIILFFFLQQNKNHYSDGTSESTTTSNYDSIQKQPTNVPNANALPTEKRTEEIKNEPPIIIKSNNPKNPAETTPNTSRESLIKEDISNYVNNPGIKNDIAVLVIDKYNNLLSTMTSEVASLYKNKGYTVTTSLFTTDFIKSKYLDGVQNANYKVLDKLGLASTVNYIVIAKYSNDFDFGEQTKWVCRANLEVTVIGCASKSLVGSFSLPGSNGFDDKQHAEKGAIEKIMLSYKTSHLNL